MSKIVTLTEEQADELRADIEDLMHHWHPNPQAADYCCEFCYVTANTNMGSIVHRQDCRGNGYLQMLTRSHEIALYAPRSEVAKSACEAQGVPFTDVKLSKLEPGDVLGEPAVCCGRSTCSGV